MLRCHAQICVWALRARADALIVRLRRADDPGAVGAPLVPLCCHACSGGRAGAAVATVGTWDGDFALMHGGCLGTADTRRLRWASWAKATPACGKWRPAAWGLCGRSVRGYTHRHSPLPMFDTDTTFHLPMSALYFDPISLHRHDRVASGPWCAGAKGDTGAAGPTGPVGAPAAPRLACPRPSEADGCCGRARPGWGARFVDTLLCTAQARRARVARKETRATRASRGTKATKVRSTLTTLLIIAVTTFYFM